ncbi:D-2-hydroxyacid dehydrogenase family protein [Tumebacillus sp. ITR2]|uniref:D-2-hydroxyacid dehydrogenase family protein n=1 Tax=Tumebacillus amylolyticus TaxID=2801339 RepID=A0ABS1JBU0_9BACL|nr:D-2-hydroxyacid dehydrogenase family protein [Tumebacillus amylolyticus]MBL0387731.1 D-2-hydroxyacid dehydrogenase family protein [Tumebacillus amylolyticus]
MKTVILDDWDHATATIEKIETLKQFSDVEIYHDQPSKAELYDRVRDADAVIFMRERTKVTKELLDNMENIKLLAQTGTGLAHIDVAEVTQRNLPIATTPGGSTAAVTELTFAFLLALGRNLLNFSNQMREGAWPAGITNNISGKTLGLIGLGKIGLSVAKVAKAFGMNVVAWGPRLTQERADAAGVTYRELDQLLSESHFVSLHVRLVPETRNLLQRKHFELMRNDAFLINTSRGELVDEEALIWALENRQIKGAGLDVFHQEPLDPNNAILKLNNVILAPHIGWKTDTTFASFLNGSIDNIESFFQKGEPTNIANQEVLHNG